MTTVCKIKNEKMRNANIRTFFFIVETNLMVRTKLLVINHWTNTCNLTSHVYSYFVCLCGNSTRYHLLIVYTTDRTWTRSSTYITWGTSACKWHPPERERRRSHSDLKIGNWTLDFWFNSEDHLLLLHN